VYIVQSILHLSYHSLTSPIMSQLSSSSSTNNTPPTTFYGKIKSICREHEFVLLILLAIGLAKLNPTIGIQYCYPEITATWLAVILIFVLSGLSLPTSELHIAAFHNIPFNIYIQCFNFFFVSGFVYCVCHYVLYPYHIIQSIHLLHGMIVCSCLPMAINTVIVITKSSHGDDAAAIFNCALANLIGVVISPFLILLFIGMNSKMNPVDVFIKLTLRVLLPVFVGQLLQRLAWVQVHIISKHKHIFKNLQQYCLVYIVYTVFCSTFVTPSASSSSSNTALSTRDVIMVFICQIALLLLVMIIAWTMLRYWFPNQPKLQAMGFVGCTFKTVAVGVPLVNAMYAATAPELVALYTLPLLIWHPMQLIIGSLLAPYLARYVDAELERLQEQSSTQDGIAPTETTALLVSQKV
jgi:solute carrier family 10 (sodium/bile acid cotransporter), member 7